VTTTTTTTTVWQNGVWQSSSYGETTMEELAYGKSGNGKTATY